MKNEKEVSVVIESPVKKIIFVGAVMVVFIIFIELMRNYLESNPISFLQNKYVLYSVIGIAVIGLALFLVIFIIKRNKKLPDISKNASVAEKNEDTKKVLKIVDNLLEKLPEKELKKFSGTKDAELYRSVLKKYGIK